MLTANTPAHTHTPTHTHVNLYIFLCIGAVRFIFVNDFLPLLLLLLLLLLLCCCVVAGSASCSPPYVDSHRTVCKV